MAQFTITEIEVMKILWAHDALNPTEIQELHPRTLKNAALRFQLKVLLEKGHISRRKIGRSYRYRAITPRQGTFTKMARRMADVFTGGSTVGLIAELIKSEELSEAEVEELKQYAAKKRPPRRTKRGR